jgi:hypothetical protein
MASEPLLFQKPIYERLLLARKRAATGGRGAFCLVYGTLEKAHNFEPMQKMVQSYIIDDDTPT